MKSLFVLLALVFSLATYAKPEPENTTVFPFYRDDSGMGQNVTYGRYIYIGTVPKFANPEDLEITVSKLSLTARVKAWVRFDLIKNYRKNLYFRYKTMKEAASEDIFEFMPLISIDGMLDEANFKNKNSAMAIWIDIIKQYGEHILEDKNPDLFVNNKKERLYLNNVEYKEKFLDALKDYYFDGDLSDLDNLEKSEALFYKHMKNFFTEDSSKSEEHKGYLTFVYPISATTEGPFDQPKEQLKYLLAEVSINARWWSNKWKHEFAGMPFLQIDWGGVAFHGPITNVNTSMSDVWFLRRWYVSHGCLRMNVSDLMELRALMPYSLKNAKNKIKITILDMFDLFDFDNDGVDEITSVDYYLIPNLADVKANLKTAKERWSIKSQQIRFFKYNPYIKQAGIIFNENNYTFKNFPTYTVNKGILKRGDLQTKETKIHPFPYSKSRVIQYREANLNFSNILKVNPDTNEIEVLNMNDNLGKYPPAYFMKY